MNTTLGLGLGLRARARVAAKAKATTLYGARVVGKSSVSAATRKATRPSPVVVRASAEPLLEAPFKGIKDDIAGRAPVYLDDFKQGLNGKALVRRRRPVSAVVFSNRDLRAIRDVDDLFSPSSSVSVSSSSSSSSSSSRRRRRRRATHPLLPPAPARRRRPVPLTSRTPPSAGVI